ncbi:hypothetical protein ABT297_41350 [Dactylosporangium sp. NPDC000555]|uniref:hypothetical protein n=1 Tax=Dactylosporangium sp. NPDC000555 TaxID=3154260 RepID=UPI00332207B8
MSGGVRACVVSPTGKFSLRMSIYAVFLDGWDHKSTWGWDDGVGSYYAQMTGNGKSDANGPEIWITPPTFPEIMSPAALAEAIARATGENLGAVQRAMNDGLNGAEGHLHRIEITDGAVAPHEAVPNVADPVEHPVAAIVADAAVATADRLMREAGMMPLPTAHMFMDDVDPPYVGYVATRPFYRGADAAEAIGRLGELPAALYATRLLLVWEHADLYTALQMPGETFPTALVTVEATLSAHTLIWRPFTFTWGPAGSLGTPTVLPAWGTPVTYRSGALPTPVGAAIDRWRRLGSGEIEAVTAALQRAQFQVKLIAPSA